MSSQPLSFGELLAGGILLTMGVTGSSVRDVFAGKAKTVKPIAAGAGAGGSTSTASENTAWTGAAGVSGASKSAEGLVKLAESQKGVQEGSTEQAKFASAAGISAAQAWCAAFVTWALKRVGVTNLPADPASVSSWESWSGGQRVSTSNRSSWRIGDLIAFSGEHIGIYIGNGRMISGNWGNEVAIAPISQETEPITAVIRVKGLYAEAVKSLGRGAAGTLGFTGKTRV